MHIYLNPDQDGVSLLGNRIEYPINYNPDLLKSISRYNFRKNLGMNPDSLPFWGFDLWTAFELSWLNDKGKPVVAIGEFTIPAQSSYIIESKSLKLYLNSFNQTSFKDTKQISEVLKKDLSYISGDIVSVKLYPNFQYYPMIITKVPGINIDFLDVEINNYQFDPELLSKAVNNQSEYVSETLASNLLKSNCMITNQPDWGSIIINYEGKKISHEYLLRYIISFRNFHEFHEPCVERIFTNIKNYCKPAKLSVFARYNRRGGVDINPYRSDFEHYPSTKRLIRQ